MVSWGPHHGRLSHRCPVPRAGGWPGGRSPPRLLRDRVSLPLAAPSLLPRAEPCPSPSGQALPREGLLGVVLLGHRPAQGRREVRPLRGLPSVGRRRTRATEGTPARALGPSVYARLAGGWLPAATPCPGPPGHPFLLCFADCSVSGGRSGFGVCWLPERCPCPARSWGAVSTPSAHSRVGRPGLAEPDFQSPSPARDAGLWPAQVASSALLWAGPRPAGLMIVPWLAAVAVPSAAAGARAGLARRQAGDRRVGMWVSGGQHPQPTQRLRQPSSGPCPRPPFGRW